MNKNKIVRVIAKCVGCGKEREIGPGEIDKNDVPMCNECFLPMVAKKAIKRECRR